MPRGRDYFPLPRNYHLPRRRALLGFPRPSAHRNTKWARDGWAARVRVVPPLPVPVYSALAASNAIVIGIVIVIVRPFLGQWAQLMVFTWILHSVFTLLESYIFNRTTSVRASEKRDSISWLARSATLSTLMLYTYACIRIRYTLYSVIAVWPTLPQGKGQRKRDPSSLPADTDSAAVSMLPSRCLFHLANAQTRYLHRCTFPLLFSSSLYFTACNVNWRNQIKGRKRGTRRRRERENVSRR